MTRFRRFLPLLLAAGLVVVLLLRSRSGQAPEAGRTSPPAADPAPVGLPGLLRPLGLTLLEEGGEAAAETAREIRDLVLADPAALEEARRLLLDPTAAIEVRRVLAIVLASLGPAGKSAVLGALRSGKAEALARTLVLALGLQEPDDANLFERDGQPHSVEAAPGLTVFVFGVLEDPDARAEASKRLMSDDPALRRAAALALRDSTAFPEVRRGLLDRVREDADGETAAEAAAALGSWARTAAGGDSERVLVVSALLDLAPRGEEVVRLRLTAPLSSLALDGAEALRLRALASDPSPDARRFAVDLLGRRAIAFPADSARPVLERALAADADAEVRESAALALGRGGPDVRPVAALESALRGDSDWEVRAAAARSLSGVASAKAALEAAATSDAHPGVRGIARRVLDDTLR